MKFFVFVFSLLFSINVFAGTISPELNDILSRAGKDDSIPVLLKFRQKKLKTDDIKKKGRLNIIKNLKDEHKNLKEHLKNTFDFLGIKKINDLWHIKGFAFSAKPDVIKKLSEIFDDVDIKFDSVIYAPSFEIKNEIINEWNIDLIGAPYLWNLGIKGQGVVVANLDTGVDYTHPDLNGKWRGGNNSWFDPYGLYSEPHDYSGHGTGTMGIIVGGNYGGTNIGIAPESKWISAKIFDNSGKAYISKIHQAFAWVLDPDGNPDTDDSPDIVNNSWGFVEINQCNNEFEDDIEILRNADIAVIFSAGNSGPLKPSSSSPADYQNSFSVGSIDNNLNISYFSSRGPSACTNDIFPNVVAPGSYVKTADLYLGGSITNPYSIVSGTSFSAPHVSGALALLKSAFPEKTMEELMIALKMSAIDLGSEGSDNDYGAGLINVKNAYNYLLNLPEMAIDKETYTFPKTILSKSLPSVTFIIKNNGYGTLNISSISLSDIINFSIVSENCSGSSLSFKETCNINLIFNPVQTGIIQSDLIIVSNDRTTPEKMIKISGIGVLEKLKLLSPNGGESLLSGNSFEIKWAGTVNTEFYTIQLSKNGGFTWTTIAKFITGYTFDWVAPSDIYNRTKCLIRILGYDSKKRLISKDVSDLTFSIYIVKIVVPVDGDIIANGSVLRIYWETYKLLREVSKVELYFSSNNGFSWKKIGEISGNPGFFDWNVMGVISSKCYFKIIFKDMNNRTIGVVKNNLPFSII